jgi:hypothetical protein
MSAALVLALTVAANALAAPAPLSRALDDLPGGELILVSDPLGKKPVRVLVAGRVAAPVAKVRAALGVVDTYPAAVPNFRKVEVFRPSAGAPDVAWELEIPLWNLSGRLRVHPRSDGVDLDLHEGDLSPGRFSLTAHAESPARTLLLLEAYANVKDANWAVRRITSRSPLGEPAILVAAAYVLHRALAILFEHGRPVRPQGAMAVAPMAALPGPKLAFLARDLAEAAPGKVLTLWVRNRRDGRLSFVAGAFPSRATVAQVAARAATVRAFQSVLGWKDTTVEDGSLPECQDPGAKCLVVDSGLPFFDLDATWKLWGGQFRAKAVDETLKGAVMALDAIPHGTGSMIALSQSMGLHRSGYFPRKLIAAEPLLEQGLAVALVLADLVCFAKAVE